MIYGDECRAVCRGKSHRRAGGLNERRVSAAGLPPKRPKRIADIRRSPLRTRCSPPGPVGVIRGDLLVQAFGHVDEQIAGLVHRAAPNRHTVPDRGDRLVESASAVDKEEWPQFAFDEMVEHGAPGLVAFAARAS